MHKRFFLILSIKLCTAMFLSIRLVLKLNIQSSRVESLIQGNVNILRECNGSVVECLTRDRGGAGLSLTSVTWARHIKQHLEFEPTTSSLVTLLCYGAHARCMLSESSTFPNRDLCILYEHHYTSPVVSPYPVELGVYPATANIICLDIRCLAVEWANYSLSTLFPSALRIVWLYF